MENFYDLVLKFSPGDYVRPVRGKLSHDARYYGKVESVDIRNNSFGKPVAIYLRLDNGKTVNAANCEKYNPRMYKKGSEYNRWKI